MIHTWWAIIIMITIPTLKIIYTLKYIFTKPSFFFIHNYRDSTNVIDPLKTPKFELSLNIFVFGT